LINKRFDYISDKSFEETYNYFLLEKKIYNIVDFKVFEYKAIYDDLINLSDINALHHYINHGIKEKRYNSFDELFKNLNLDSLIPFFLNNTKSIGKIKLLNYATKKIGLKVSEYKAIYEDTKCLTDYEAKLHYFQFGISENRFRSYDQIKKKLDNSLSLNLHQVLFDKTSNFLRNQKSKIDFLNLYFHLVDENTQHMAKKDINKFKKKAIFEIFHLFINDKSISPYPIHYFLQNFYDIIFRGKSSIENNFIFNEKLIENFIKGKNLSLIENNYNKIYVLVTFARIFSLDDSFFYYLIDDSENLIDYYKSLINFIIGVFKLKIGDNLENLLSQYFLLIELYLIKFVPNYWAEILFEKKDMIKIRQKATDSFFSSVKFNIIFLNYPCMSFCDILDGLNKLRSLNLEYIDDKN